MMKNLHFDKKGVALLTVVLFFLVMVILLGGLLFATVNNLKNTQTAQKHTSVYYAAESGINLQVAKFLNLFETAKDENWTVGSLNASVESLKNQINSDNEVLLKDNLGNPVKTTITISGPFTETDFPNHTFYSIQSVGSVGGVERTLSTNFGYEYIPGVGDVAELAAAIIVNGSINIDSGFVEGPIASNMEPVGSAVLNIKNFGKNNSAFTCDLVGEDYGDIVLPQSYIDLANSSNTDLLMNPCPSITKPQDKKIVFSDIKIGEFTSYDKLVKVTATSSSLTLPSLPSGKVGFWIEDLDINRNGNFVINLGTWAESEETLITLRVKAVSLTNGIRFSKGNIIINGKGRLQVLVDQTSEIDIATDINVDDTVKDPNKFMLILRTNNMPRALKISNNTKVVSSILTDSTANIDWKNMIYYGILVSNAGFISGENALQTYEGVVNFQAGSVSGETGYPPIWIYAPYANVHLQSAGTEVVGMIMGNSFSMSTQGGGVKYELDEDMDYPFNTWVPLPYLESGDPINSSIEYRITPIKEN